MNTDTALPKSSGAVHVQCLHWMGLSLRIPADWHLRRHGISPEAGSLVFVDRRSQRMELLWSHPEREPDTVRMVQHGIEALQNDQPELILSAHLPGRIPGWEGFSYDLNPRTYRALQYHPEHKLLLQVTLSLDGIREDAHRQAREILSALTVAEAPEHATHWRAFGLECRMPPGFALRQARVLPMDVLMRFEHAPAPKRRPSRKGSVTLRRLGMAADWFDGDLEAYARRRTSGLRCEVKMETQDLPVCQVLRRVRASGVAGRFGAKTVERLRLWHDPASNSLFELTLREVPEPERMLPQIQVHGVPGWMMSAAPAPAPAFHAAETEPERLVEGIPVRNAAVIEEPAPQGAVLRVPLRPRWWTRGVFRWVFPVRDTRAFGMDTFGAEVWADCDGIRTVESICERFARRHSVSYDEAKAAVYQFLQTLTQRELILIQLPKPCPDHS